MGSLPVEAFLEEKKMGTLSVEAFLEEKSGFTSSGSISRRRKMRVHFQWKHF